MRLIVRTLITWQRSVGSNASPRYTCTWRRFPDRLWQIRRWYGVDFYQERRTRMARWTEDRCMFLLQLSSRRTLVQFSLALSRFGVLSEYLMVGALRHCSLTESGDPSNLFMPQYRELSIMPGKKALQEFLLGRATKTTDTGFKLFKM